MNLFSKTRFGRFTPFLFLLILFICGLVNKGKAETDPYAQYMNSVPAVKQVLSQDTSGTVDSAIITRKFIFSSRNSVNSVYAIMAFPKQQGKYPAVMFLHGGGSQADDVLPIVQSYARRGYVTFAFDMPGICNNTKTPNSSGPWKSRPGVEPPRFDIAKGLQNSTLVDAEVAGIEAFNYLSQQENVDADKIGISGYSWGGYSTTMLAGLLGKKIKAAYSVFGCGYYERGSFWVKIIADLPDSVRTPWLKYFDAGRRAPNIKAPYFLEATSNDTYFWPEAVEGTLNAIHGTKNHVWDPNFNHRQMPAGITMQQIFLDHYLKGVGQPFGTAKIIHQTIGADSSMRVSIRTDMPAGVIISSVVIYYSEHIGNWQTRVWVPINAQLKGKNYEVSIPGSIVKKGADFYAYVIDNRTVAVASDMYNTLTGMVK